MNWYSAFHEEMLNEPSIQSKIAVLTEVERRSLVGARRQGRILHLINSVTISPYALFASVDAWAEQVRSVLKNDSNQEGKALGRLFDMIVLHSQNEKEEILVTEKSKCDHRRN